jgi:hypothetical protein
MADTCYDILYGWKIPGSNIPYGTACTSGVYLFNASLMLYWVCKQRRNAQMGEEEAAEYVVFPIYVPILVYSAIVDSTYGIQAMYYMSSSEDAKVHTIIEDLTISLEHGLIEGVAFLLMQKGCGYRALVRSGVGASLWTAGCFICYYSYHFNSGWTAASFITLAIWDSIICVFYLLLWLLPKRTYFRRPSLIFYAKFWACLRVIGIVADILLLKDLKTNNLSLQTDVGYCSKLLLSALFAIGKL